jgi:hypothetical protein
MQDPGLDRHTWETELEGLREELHESPAQALPDLANLVQRVLEERGFHLNEPSVEDDEPELVTTYRGARDTADRAEEGEADPGDVAQAIEDLLFVYESIAVERPAP